VALGVAIGIIVWFLTATSLHGATLQRLAVDSSAMPGQCEIAA
jgi:hypothetical protein